MFVIIFLFLCITAASTLEAVPPHDELVEEIMQTARKSFLIKENIEVLKTLVYEQNFTNSQTNSAHPIGNGTDKEREKSTLVSSLKHFLNGEGSGYDSETSEEDKRRDNFFKYIVGLYNEFPLVRVGYNNPCEFDKNTGYVTVCFFIQPKYHHAALVFEYPGWWNSVNAEMFHLTYAEESGSHENKKKVFSVRREGKEDIINRLVWAKNNKSGNDENPDRGILRWYPYCTFEVNLTQMYKALSKVGWEALKRKHSYNYMGLVSHNCCTYVAEQLEEMGINLRYKKSYNLYFTDEDFKRTLSSYAGHSKRMYEAKFWEPSEENPNDLPLAIANRSNLYRALKVRAERIEERVRIEEEKKRKKAEVQKQKDQEREKWEEERKKEMEKRREKEKKDELKLYFKLKTISLAWKGYKTLSFCFPKYEEFFGNKFMKIIDIMGLDPVYVFLYLAP